MASTVRLKHSRSHSASPIPRKSPGDSWRVATKRAHPHQLGPDLSSPQKWDVDVWRRGKRRRRNVSNDSDEMQVDFSRPVFHSSPIPTLAPTPAFAATSADFLLFPNNRAPDRKRRATHHTEPEVDLDFNTPARTADLTRLRSDAFWQLRRSVEENGEGFVQSMRVYETRRSRSSVGALKVKEAQRRGRRRSPVHTAPATARDDSEDEDDIQIFAGEAAAGGFSARGKQRAFSVGVVKEPLHSSGFERSERCSSPGATCDSRSSIYLSDDDGFRAPTPKSPSLSHTLSHSANSSLVSLHLPPPFAPRTTLPSSRSEKAIAALSLAMANGAGLDDYSQVVDLDTFSPDNCHVGDMFS
ncbi:hypothetical protein C8R46DRAFT_1089616 [Mycena filopes]|nr:hypothetical protein C8R46DRAFT_1089616 [Mycena filopes]